MDKYNETVVKKEGSILSAFRDNTFETEQLNKIIGELEARLSRILRMFPPNTTKSEEISVDWGCDLACELAKNTQGIRLGINSISNIIDRLEL